jgi:chromosome partitioning protein
LRALDGGGNLVARANSRERMGLFSRSKDDHREPTTRDDRGAELAELGQRSPEPAVTVSPEPDPAEEMEPVNENPRETTHPEEPAVDLSEELHDVEEAVEEPEVRAAPPVAEPVDEERDAENERITFDDALSPRRPATTGLADPGVSAAQSERRAKVISFANQKGGVAKTTTTLNLAVAFAESGHKVLCVDLDPQGNLTMSQGIDPDKVETSMYDVLVHHIPIREVIHEREIDIAVASIDLAGAEIAMSTQIGRERSLEKALSVVADDYDFVCIDTPPSLGLLTVNALTASDKVIVPVQCEYLSMRGLMQLQGTLEMIRENLNPRVQIEGILPTMLDSRTVHAKEAVEILEENFGELVFKSRIRKAIKFAEAPVRGASVLKYDPKSNAADYYRELAKEVLTHGAS